MTILTPVISVLTIVAYFILSMFMPILGYLVPCYKIKKVNIFGSKYRILINLAVALVLYALNIKILMLYLIYPFLTEFLFYFTQRFVKKIRTFDRIIIMSLISTLVIFGIIYLNRNYLEATIKDALEVSSSTLKIDIANIYQSFLYLKENMLSAIFSYLFIGNIFLFLALSVSLDNFGKWKISCYWIIPFIIIILMNRVLKISYNSYLESNIISLVRYIYTWYGIKIIYELCGKVGVKFSILKHVLSVVLGITYPLPVFIVGAMMSFDIVEVETIKL